MFNILFNEALKTTHFPFPGGRAVSTSYPVGSPLEPLVYTHTRARLPSLPPNVQRVHVCGIAGSVCTPHSADSCLRCSSCCCCCWCCYCRCCCCCCCCCC